MAPHHQVHLLWVLTLVTILAVILTGPIALGSAKSGVTDAVSRLVPSSAALTVVSQNYAAGTADLLVVAANGTSSPAFNQLVSLDTTANAAWRTFEHSSANLPGESKLDTQIDAAIKQLTATGTLLLSSSNPTPAQISAVTNAAAAQQAAVGKLQALYQAHINGVVKLTDEAFAARQRDLWIVGTIAVLLTMVAFGAVAVSIRRRYRVQLDEGRRNDLESGLQRALELIRTEPQAYGLVRRAVQQTSPTLRSELLVADSSRAHFVQVITTDPDGGPGCPVMSPDACPATNRGQTQTWTTSGAIDACPYLQDRPTGPCSAVCVPVSIAGKTVGVVHAIGSDHHPPTPSTAANLELIARKAGERIGVLRAFSRTEAQARTDPLTGLLNRRSLEAAVRDLTAEAHTYAVAYGDLDHFKLLNDVHGHETGDRALRLFARVLRDGLRPNDIAGRWGGEEFVVVLPDCTIADAYAVVDRVRGRLAEAQTGGAVPPFTVSFGLVPGAPDLAFGEIVEQADAALLQAKSEGRDRVILAGGREGPPEPGATPDVTAAPHPTS